MAFWNRIKPPTQDFKTLGSWAFNLLKPPVKDIKTIGRAIKPPVKDIATIGRALPYTKTPFEAYKKTGGWALDKLSTKLVETVPSIKYGYQPTGKNWEELNVVEKTKAVSQQFNYQFFRTASSVTVGQLGSISGALGYAERFGFKKAKPIADKLDDWAGKVSAENPDPAKIDTVMSGLGSMSVFIIPGMGAAKTTQVLTGVSPKIANLFGNSVMTFLESGMEAGGVYRDLKKQGYSEEIAKRNADIDFGINVVLLGLTNRYNFVGNKGRTLAMEIKNRLLAGGRELVQELGQQVAGNIATYKKWDEGIKEAAGVGGLLGFMFGGSVNPNINMNVQTQREILDLIQKTSKKIPIGLTIEDVSKPSDRLLETMRRPKVKPTPLKPILEADPLITEARKYKSAEEFVKAKQKDIVYHGSNQPLEKFDKRGAFFTDDMMNAEGYAGGENVYEGYLNLKNPLVIDAKGRHHSDLKTPYGKSTQEIVGKVDDKKYDGVIFKNINDSFADDIDIVGTDTIFYPFNANKSFINESQLTDIYNKAVKEVKPKLPIREIIPKKVKPVKKAVREVTRQIKPGMKEFRQRMTDLVRGLREGRVLTKKEITTTQTEIVDILDKSKLERSDKAKFIRAIKNVQTTEQLKKALPKIQARIEKLSEEAESKTVIKKIQKAIKVTTVKGKKPKGKYTSEIQNVLNSIKKLTDLNQKKANEKIEDNLKEYAVKMPVEIAVENHLLSLYTGTSKQKQELLNIINQLKEKGEVASSLKKFNIQADIERKSELVVSRVTSDKGIEEGRLHGEPADKTKVQKVKQYLKAVGKKTILDWRGLMTTLDFNSSVKVKPLADFFSVSKNESKYKELQSKYVDNFNEAVSSIYDVKNKPNSILKVVNKMTTEKVKVGEYEYTRDELIKRHMEIQDPTLIESLERGNKFTEKTFKDIEDKITEQDKKFAQWQLEYYQEMYSKVNEIYSKMNGVDLPFNEFYSPIRRVGYQVEPGHTEFMDEAFYRKAVTSKSLISRIKNLNPILKQSSLSVLDRHITDTNYYIAWAEKIRELDSVFTNNEVREAIKQEFPSSLLESINTKIQHISTHGNKTASRIGWVDYIRKSYVVGNLAVKPALTIKQLVSTLAFAEKISAKDLTVGILDFAKNPIKNYQTLQNESWFIKMRGAGMERDIRDAIKEGVFDRYNKRQNLANSLLLNVKLGDKGAIVLGSWAMRRARLKAGIPLQDVINEYEEFSADTQQSADISRLSEIQLGGSLEKLFTVFKSSQRAYLQKEVNAVKSMFRKDGFGKDNVKRVAKVMFIYHILLPVTFQWISNMGGWDEDDKKDYQRAAIWGSLNGLFIAGDVIGAIISQVMGMRVWDIDVLVVDIGDDINKAISNLTEEDVDIEDIQTALDALASATTSLSGLPVEYSYDILESLYNGNYETAMKQILGWSEYVIGEEKTAYEEAVSAQKEKEKKLKEEMEPKYEEIKELKEMDRSKASKMYKELSAEEKKAYQSIKRSEEAKKLSGREDEIYPTYLEIQEMKKTDYQEARKMYTDLSKEDRKVYQKIKTKLE